MTAYALDTNACIALINGRTPLVREQFANARAAGDTMAISSIVLFELRYGTAKSQRPEATAARLNTFLEGPLEIIEFDDEDAADAGAIRATLERTGTPIGAYDVLIAGQAHRRGLTVVTANVREFSRIPGLAWEDWAAV